MTANKNSERKSKRILLYVMIALVLLGGTFAVYHRLEPLISPTRAATGGQDANLLTWPTAQYLQAGTEDNIVTGSYYGPFSQSFYYYDCALYADIRPDANGNYYTDRAVVILYHDFTDEERGTAISAARLATHLDMLANDGFNIVSLDDVAAFVEGKKDLPPNAVAITMDDGYLSNCEIARPLLQAKGWPATVFMRVGDAGLLFPDTYYRRLMNWDELALMTRSGISIQSHTYKGHNYISGKYPDGQPWLTSHLPGESDTEYQERIYNDLVQSKQALDQNLHQDTVHFAYPFGAYNDAAIEALHKAGYKYMWTTEHKPVTRDSNPALLGRVSIGIIGTTAGQLKASIVAVGRQ